MGWFTQGGSRCAPLPWATIWLPLRGAGQVDRPPLRRTRVLEPTPGSWLVHVRGWGGLAPLTAIVRPKNGYSEYVGRLSQLEASVCSAARSARVVLHEGRAQRFSEVESWHWHRSGARTCLSNRGDHLDHPESRTTLCKMRSENPLETVLSARALSSLWALRIAAGELIMELILSHILIKTGPSQAPLRSRLSRR